MQHSKFSRILTITALLATFALTGCIGGSGTSEPTRYYTLAVENVNMPAPAGENAARIQVRKFTVEAAYQRANIVYRESAYDFMFYDLDLWASRPEAMMTQIVTEYVNKSGLFKPVEAKPTVKPDYEMLGHLNALEEVDEGSNRFARVALTLTFRKTEAENALWEGHFDEKIAMNGSEPRHVAEAASKLLARYMEEALKNIASVAK